MTRYFVPFLLILGAAFSRMLPHPPNVAPITALALFSAVYLDKKYAFIVPLLAMLISDYFIGFYSGMIWVYGSFMVIGCLGLFLRRRLTPFRLLASSLSGSVVFYIVTNFGVWASPHGLYPHTLTGLGVCYGAAIPFFRNTLLADLLYVGTMFGLYEIASRYVTGLRPKPIVEE